jgi:hypothetical protein
MKVTQVGGQSLGFAAKQAAEFAFQHFAGFRFNRAHAAAHERIKVPSDRRWQPAFQLTYDDFNSFSGVVLTDTGFLHNEID